LGVDHLGIVFVISSCSINEEGKIIGPENELSDIIYALREDTTVEYSSYSFKINGGPCPSVLYEGDKVEKVDWNPNENFIYLENDPDYDSKQIMSMYIFYEVHFVPGEVFGVLLDSENPLNKLATSCIVYGPGSEAKPRLYRPTNSHSLDSITIGSNFIAGKVANWTYDRVLVYPDDEPETVTVDGWFVAKQR
jgi:hypothetical protein